MKFRQERRFGSTRRFKCRRFIIHSDILIFLKIPKETSSGGGAGEMFQLLEVVIDAQGTITEGGVASVTDDAA